MDKNATRVVSHANTYCHFKDASKLTHSDIASLINSVSFKKVRAGYVRKWFIDPERKSYLSFPDWAVEAFEAGLKKAVDTGKIVKKTDHPLIQFKKNKS